MHPKEAKKERLGTGRLVHHALLNSELIMGVDFTEVDQVNRFLNTEKYNPLLMYPGDNAISVSNLDKVDIDSDKETVIFILDGTWPFAKKMMRKSKNLHNLPRITFDIKTQSRFRIKQQPHEMCLSTLEAVVQFLDECENQNIEKLNKKHHKLLSAFEGLIKFQENCAIDPNIIGYRKNSYKLPSERIPSKKWQQYGIFYNG